MSLLQNITKVFQVTFQHTVYGSINFVLTPALTFMEVVGKTLSIILLCENIYIPPLRYASELNMISVGRLIYGVKRRDARSYFVECDAPKIRVVAHATT